MGFLAPMPALDSLLGSLRGCLDRFPDKRRGMNATYGIGDIGMAAFSVFFMQSPSFLAHQRQLEEGHGGSVANISNGRAKPERPDYLILPVNRTAAPNTAPLSAATDPCGSCASTQRRIGSRLRTRMICTRASVVSVA